MRLKTLIFATMALLITVVAPGSQTIVGPRLSFSVTNAVSPHPGALRSGFPPGLGVVFRDQPVQLRVELTADPKSRGETSSGPSALLLNDPWWKHLTIRLKPLDEPEFPAAQPVAVGADDFGVVRSWFSTVDRDSNRRVERESSQNLGLAETASVEVRIPSPPVGDYMVELCLRDFADAAGEALSTLPKVIAVREGNENLPLRRMYLTELRKAATTFEAFREIQLKLIELEPDAWGLWEDLANVSLDERPPAETLSYYEKASQIAARVARATDEPSTRSGQRTTLFKQLFPLYAQQHERLKLVPTIHKGVATFEWVDRKTGKVLGYVDPSRPELPSAVKSPK